jgi:hypothetical protein
MKGITSSYANIVDGWTENGNIANVFAEKYDALYSSVSYSSVSYNEEEMKELMDEIEAQ